MTRANAARPDANEAHELIARFGSPLYVYDLAEVALRFREFVAAFVYRPLDCHYAIVCNKNPWIVQTLRDAGAGVHANTPGDAYAALTAGVSADRIVYTGSNLTLEDFAFVLGHRLAVNVDSLDQVRDLTRLRRASGFGVRVLIDGAEKRNRIGLEPTELSTAVAIAAAHGVRIVGAHMYVGTNTRRAFRFLECLDRLLAATDALPDLEYVDIGGGYGVGYRDGEDDLDLAGLGRAVSDRMTALSERRGHAIRLIAEPGRTVVASSGSLLATVVSVKTRGGRRYVGVDSTVGNIAVPSVYHAHHRVELLAEDRPPADVPTDVCGNTTHSRDYLARDIRLPETRQGDVLALRDVGAYAYAMSSHFLNRPRPAEVVLDGATAVETTRRETLEDLVALQQTV